MTGKIAKQAEKIVSIPVDFAQTNKSAITLLWESGYFDSPDEITVELLANALEDAPELIESWLAWSDNKRADSGWYFQCSKLGEFVIGYFPPTENIPLTRYSEAHVAGANFIKREIENIREALN